MIPSTFAAQTYLPVADPNSATSAPVFHPASALLNTGIFALRVFRGEATLFVRNASSKNYTTRFGYVKAITSPEWHCKTLSSMVGDFHFVFEHDVGLCLMTQRGFPPQTAFECIGKISPLLLKSPEETVETRRIAAAGLRMFGISDAPANVQALTKVLREKIDLLGIEREFARYGSLAAHEYVKSESFILDSSTAAEQRRATSLFSSSPEVVVEKLKAASGGASAAPVVALAQASNESIPVIRDDETPLGEHVDSCIVM